MSGDIERELREIKRRLDELEEEVRDNRGHGSLTDQVEDLRQQIEGRRGVDRRLEHVEKSLEEMQEDFRPL